jgi:polyisoprenyl-teichoic acid--peptidoglycan teichoic acid transferase
MIKKVSILVVFVALVAMLVPPVGRETGRAASIAAGRVHASFNPSKGKIFVLIIGNDARYGNPDRSRADAIHIAGINTRTMRAGILNFPRDSWVNLSGGGQGKINEALYRSGPRGLARTLENITGIRLDFWVMTGFKGFTGLIKDLGGVKVNLPGPVNDLGSGARLRAGTQVLDPGEALAYARSRKAFSGGDITRTSNQGRLLLSLLKKLRKEVGSDPASLLDWLGAVQRNTRSDISATEIFRLGVLATQLSRSRVRSITVPVSIGTVGSASVVFISPRARSIYARFRRHGSL